MKKHNISLYLIISLVVSGFVAFVHWLTHMITSDLVGKGILFTGFVIPIVGLTVFLTVFVISFLGLLFGSMIFKR